MTRGGWMAAGAAVAALVVGVTIAVTHGGGSKGLFPTGGDRTPAPPTSGAASGSRGGGGGDCGQPKDTGVAQVPANKNAVIFDNFGLNQFDGQLFIDISKILHDEGYEVDRFTNPTEGKEGPNDATLDNFVDMAKDCIIIFDTHGFFGSSALVQSADHQVAASQGAIVKRGDEYFATVRGVEVQIGLGTTPVLLVEWLSTQQQAQDRYVDYINGHRYTDEDIAVICVDDVTKPNSSCLSWGIGLTAEGMARFFANAHTALIDAISCYSSAFANYFLAHSYFGYDRVCYSGADNHVATDDSRMLFQALAGQVDIHKRTTKDAASLDYSRGFKLYPPEESIALSPAVLSVDPPDKAHVKAGQTTPVTVTFDAMIDTSVPAEDAVSAGGTCGTIEHAEWGPAGTTLTFDYVVPTQPKGTSDTLTLAPDKVHGGSGFANPLDGNSNPSGTDGVAPNADDRYQWKLDCGAGGLGIFVSGTDGSFTLDGEIGGPGASIRCDGHFNVFASGDVPNGTYVSLEMHGIGVATFGTPATVDNNGLITLNLPGHLHAAGAGAQAGSGTITVTAAGAGSVEATLDDGVKVTGSWNCP